MRKVQRNPNKDDSIPRLLLGEAPAAAGDEGTPRTLCSHSLINQNRKFPSKARKFTLFYCTNYIRKVLDAVLRHYAGEVCDDVAAGVGVDEVSGADLDCGCAREHHFDDVLG